MKSEKQNHLHNEDELSALKKSIQHSNKRLLNAEIVIASISVVAFLSILGLSIFIIEKAGLLVMPILMIVLGFAILLAGTIYSLYIEQKAGWYVCKKCGHKHIPSFSQMFWSPHVLRTRFMKCPHCKKRSWNKKVID